MNTMLKKELEKTKEELNSTKIVLLQDQEDETQNLWFSLDSLEQYTHKNSLEFHGIPECLYADAQDVVISVAKKIDVDIEQDDIEIVHKLQRKKGNKPIIAKLNFAVTKLKPRYTMLSYNWSYAPFALAPKHRKYQCTLHQVQRIWRAL